MHNVIGLLILVAGFVTSCDSNRVYEENFSIENSTWHKDDVKEFAFDVTDTLSPLDLFVNIRTTSDYPYSNLHLFLYSEYPNGYSDKDTLEFLLAEPNGKWLGEHSGTVVEFRIMIAHGGVFSTPGKYVFKIQHAMREDELPEILDVGFRVALTDAK